MARAMSRDARQVITTFCELVGKEIDIEDVLVAESLCFVFYPRQVVSVIKQIHKRSKSEEKNKLAYYVQPVVCMMKQKRPGHDDIWRMTEHERQIYLLVTQHYLIDDFNHEQLVQLRQICQWSQEDIWQAIRASKEEGVYSIPYLLRVLEGMEARRKERERQLDELRQQLAYRPESEGVVRRSRMELATLLYQWEQDLQNAELERKMQEWLEGELDGEVPRHLRGL